MRQVKTEKELKKIYIYKMAVDGGRWSTDDGGDCSQEEYDEFIIFDIIVICDVIVDYLFLEWKLMTHKELL